MKRPASIEILPTKQVRALLEKLLETGLYGFRIEDVAERLICDKLIEMLRERSVLLGLPSRSRNATRRCVLRR